MMSRVLAVLYGEEYDLPKKSGAYVIFKTMLDSGEKKATNLYREMKKNQRDKYYLNKREFLFFEKEFISDDMRDMAKAYNKIQLEE